MNFSSNDEDSMEKKQELSVKLNSAKRLQSRPIYTGVMYKKGIVNSKYKKRRFELYKYETITSDRYELVYVKEGSNKKLAAVLKHTLFKNKYKVSGLDDSEQGCIVLNDAIITSNPECPELGFKIKPSGSSREYFLKCESEDARKEWQAKFDEVLQSFKFASSLAVLERRKQVLLNSISAQQKQLKELLDKNEDLQARIAHQDIKREKDELAAVLVMEGNLKSEISTLQLALIGTYNAKAVKQISDFSNSILEAEGSIDEIQEKMITQKESAKHAAASVSVFAKDTKAKLAVDVPEEDDEFKKMKEEHKRKQSAAQQQQPAPTTTTTLPIPNAQVQQQPQQRQSATMIPTPNVQYQQQPVYPQQPAVAYPPQQQPMYQQQQHQPYQQQPMYQQQPIYQTQQPMYQPQQHVPPANHPPQQQQQQAPKQPASPQPKQAPQPPPPNYKPRTSIVSKTPSSVEKPNKAALSNI